MKEHNSSCKQLLVSLSDYVDGDLNESICAEVEKHLAECTDCTVVVNTLRKAIELYHSVAIDEQVPDQVMQRLYMRLNLDDYLAK
jgi:anti-sigma factor RsiW